MSVVAFIGAYRLFAATIAVAQNDIKRVAYSTISQLGL
jgi:NADH:ubiquinone oxidoreductase subunit 5 (subunit L)/multisubunit Na+/H+ antiporter MnhA subunit